MIGVALGLGVALSAVLVLSLPLLSSCSGGGGSKPVPTGEADPTAGIESVVTDPKLSNIVLARVGHEEIKVKDLDWKLKIQFASMLELKGLQAIKQKQQVLRAMVEQYCWVAVAKQKGYDKDPAYTDVADLSRRFILANHAANREVYTKVKVQDADIQKYYEDNIDQYQTVARCRASMVVLGSKGEAERVRARVLAGEDIDALAGQLSIDNSTKIGLGRLGVVSHRSTIQGFEDTPSLNQAIMALGLNEVSEPIATPHGFCVVKVTEVTPAGVQPLAEVGPDIKKKIELKTSNELFAKTLTAIKEQLHAEIDEAGWDEYTYSFLTDAEIFQLAQGEPKPEDRIRHYEAVTRKNPEGKLAAQSKFMVGFTWADELKDFPKARAAFQEFLKQYPSSDLVPSAQWMLENMERGLEGSPQAAEIRRRAQSGQ